MRPKNGTALAITSAPLLSQLLRRMSSGTSHLEHCSARQQSRVDYGPTLRNAKTEKVWNIGSLNFWK